MAGPRNPTSTAAGADTGGYRDDETLRGARARYFADNAFGDDGGYGAKWVKLKVGPVPLAFPNSAARVRAVRYHDLHHVVTGYATDFVGEAEIGGWEVGSGCAGHVAAWILNLFAMGAGFWIAPGRVFRAFVRGRRSRNLYRGVALDDALLDRTVGDVRERLALTPASAKTQPRAADRAAFVFWLGMSGLLTLVSFAPLILVVWLLVRAF